MFNVRRRVWVVVGALLVLLGVLDITFEPAYRLVFGRASYSTEAKLNIPEADLQLILDRRCIHPFLAEYERTLILRQEDQILLQLAVAEDSGGYSRMNVYRISKFEFYLEGKLSSDTYYLNVSEPSIRPKRLGDEQPPADYLGAFDTDENGWRFIRAAKRL